MVEFTDGEFSKSDRLFVEEDAARMYRGLKDLLVNEFDVDRIEEGRNEFDVSAPKDKIRLHAYKEKSPHTIIHYNIQLRAASPNALAMMEREGGDVMKAEFSCSCEVKTFYPGRNSAPWEPEPVTTGNPEGSGLKSEDESLWEKSKPYKVIVSIWHDKLYSKEIKKYSSEGKENVYRLHDLFREQFGVEKTIGASGKTHYKPKWG